MRISHFFIDRPIFAAVVSIVFVILGVVSFSRLPVAQYPEIAPPIINVSGQYPGASADVVASTVAATTSALAPGYCPETLMIGGAISGYCATGRRAKLTTPRITNTIETTEAKIGRSMKK